MTFHKIFCFLMMLKSIGGHVTFDTVLSYYISMVGECEGHNVLTFPDLNLKQCALFCWHYPTCDGFAYFDVAIGHEKERCHIKQPHSKTRCHELNTYSNLTVRTYHLNMESGHASLSFFHRKSGNCRGHDISTTQPMTEEQCAFQCWKHKSCDSFVYEFQNNSCILKYPIMEYWCTSPETALFYYSYYGTWHYGSKIYDNFESKDGNCDIRSMGHKTDLRDSQCAALCWNTPACDGFVFAYSGDDNKGCYIKHPKLHDHCDSPAKKKDFYTFYLMDQIVEDVVSFYDKVDGECPGSLMGYKSYLSVEECASYCWNNSQCDGFVYCVDKNKMYGCHIKLQSMKRWCPEPMPAESYFTYYVKGGDCYLGTCNSNNTKICHDQVGGSHECECKNGYTGKNCEIEIDECEEGECFNNGTCIDKIGFYICQCLDRYIGNQCNTDSTPCLDKPCKNGAFCENVGSGRIACHCTNNARGFYCENIMPCLSNPCQNDGTCTVSGPNETTYQCDCKDAYIGVNCETAQPESTTYDFTRNGMECTWNAKIVYKKIKNQKSQDPVANLTEEACKTLCQNDETCKSISIRNTATTMCKPKKENKLTSAGDYKDADDYTYYDFTCESSSDYDFKHKKNGAYCTWNEVVINEAIDGESFETISDVTLDVCKQKCQEKENCLSINHKTICELFDYNQHSDYTFFTFQGNHYIDYSCHGNSLEYYKNKSGECAGQDVGNVSVVTLEKCAEKCWNLAECDSFVFHGNSTDDPANNCYLTKPQLETRCPVPTPSSSGYTTFHLDMNDDHSSMYYHFYKESGNCHGNTITTMTGLSEEQCAFTCWKHETCESFVYFFDTDSCVLKYPAMANWCLEPEENVNAYSYYGLFLWRHTWIITDHYYIKNGDCEQWHTKNNKADLSDTQCAALCWNTHSCTGFVFSYNYDEARGCYLRQTVSTCYYPAEKEGFYTFYLLSLKMSEREPHNELGHFDEVSGECPGSLTGYRPNITKEDCSILCFNNDYCDGFVYSCDENNMPGCHLKMPFMKEWCIDTIGTDKYTSYLIKDSACNDDPCHSNNTDECVDVRGGDYYCKCRRGYKGKLCDVEVNECTVWWWMFFQLETCFNGGQCIDLVGDYVCDCAEGYAGRWCEIDLNTCDQNPCFNEGICENLDGGYYKCHCGENYLGYNCETWKQACNSNPCEEGSTCISISQGIYECQLPPTTTTMRTTTTMTTEDDTTGDNETIIPGENFYHVGTGKKCTWYVWAGWSIYGDLDTILKLDGISLLQCKRHCEKDSDCDGIIYRESCREQFRLCALLYYYSYYSFDKAEGYDFHGFGCGTSKRDPGNKFVHSRRLRRSINGELQNMGEMEGYDWHIPEEKDTARKLQEFPPNNAYQDICMTTSGPTPNRICISALYSPTSHNRIWNVCKFYNKTELIINSSVEAIFIEEIMRNMSIPSVWAKFSSSTGYIPHQVQPIIGEKCILLRAYDYFGIPTKYENCAQDYPHFCLSFRK